MFKLKQSKLKYRALAILIVLAINGFMLVNKSFADEVDTIQDYLASQICSVDSPTSADSAERQQEACKNRLRDDARQIFDTCEAAGGDDATKLQCLAAEAQKVKEVTSGTGLTQDSDSNSLHSASDANSGKLYNYIKIVVIILSTGGGLAILGSFVFAGVQYATAGENSGSISKAKERIVYTLIALVLYLMLFSIVNWLIPGQII